MAADLFGVASGELAHRRLAAFFAAQQTRMPAYLIELMARGGDPGTIR